MAKMDVTTIQIAKETRDALKDMGKKGETYDEIIQKLLENIKECESE